MNYWGTRDLALQLFVRQRHPLRPQIYRYYMRQGNVYKATVIANQTESKEDHRLLHTIKHYILDW